MSIRVSVNGQDRHVPAQTTVAQVVAGVAGQNRGVAAAVNGQVVPRRCWAGARLRDGDRVEVVTAVQGG
jgi:sulfur carrier protein